MRSGIFITGTDTGIGKTIVTAGLLRRLRQEGWNVAPMKPVQTGAIVHKSKLHAPDLDFCLHAAGLSPSVEEYKLMAPYLYEPACSPHLAGRMHNAYPEISPILQAAERLCSTYPCLLAEGAGGVLVPLNEQETMLDLMQALAFPVLLVARSGLGTINHTLLSIQALRSAGLDLLGVIMNNTVDSKPDFISRDNPKAVERFSGIPILGEIPFIKDTAATEGHSDLWEIFNRSVTKFSMILNALSQ